MSGGGKEEWRGHTEREKGERGKGERGIEGRETERKRIDEWREEWRRDIQRQGERRDREEWKGGMEDRKESRKKNEERGMEVREGERACVAYLCHHPCVQHALHRLQHLVTCAVVRVRMKAPPVLHVPACHNPDDLRPVQAVLIGLRED